MVPALSDNSIPPNNVGWDARQIPGFCSEDNKGIHVVTEPAGFEGMISRVALSWFKIATKNTSGC